MSKSAHKIRPSRRPNKPMPEPAAPVSRANKSILLIVLVAVLAAIPFSLGKYFEFNSPEPFDGGGWVYSSAHILRGAEIGVEEAPSAQLGTLLVNILGVRLFGFGDFGPKLMQMLFQAAALILMFVAMRRLFGSILPAAVGVIVASVYLSAPLIAKYGNVKEQFMIAFMVMGISCFVLYELNKKWWMAMLAGGLLAWAPLFKPTGMSAIGAVGLFVVAQPILKHCTFKKAGRDILLLLGGAAAAMAPLYIWIIGWNVKLSVPYAFIWYTLAGFIPTASETTKAASDYITSSRELTPWAEQWPRVLRHYWTLLLPVALAAGAIIARIGRLVRSRMAAKKPQPYEYDRFVLLLAVWWVLDMGFVWISAASYEQYYLPLNASAAMLGGYLVAIFHEGAKGSADRVRWIAIGAFELLIMIAMSWNIFFGITKSPYSGSTYKDNAGNIIRTRGYLQKYREIAAGGKGAWEVVGEYIRENSQPTDKMYVWGWYPGIYVAAQRFSSAASACTMPRPSPALLDQRISKVLDEFKKEMPKFIVDSRKIHIPMDRPPYVLWPVAPKGFMGQANNGFLPRNERIIAEYDKQWGEMLATKFDQAEAQRYEILAAFRKFVRDNYDIVLPQEYFPVNDSRFLVYHRQFGPHVLFKLKEPK
ncbi:MAG TPA: glycosyltransferase family 39 protein [Sedimentisphaerales bacterium]|nr:glycosyltransferase family 39 protein [Sedimentisphaerales bacterium]